MKGPIDPFRAQTIPELTEWLRQTESLLDRLEQVVRRRLLLDPGEVYWQEGVGGAALEIVRQVHEQAETFATPQGKTAAVRQMQRAYWAIARLYSICAMAAYSMPEVLYEPSYIEAEALVKDVQRRYGRQSVDAFYHYAVDLLFDTSRHPMVGKNWMRCTAGDRHPMGADNLFGHPDHRDGQPCPMGDGGTMRRITWADVMGDSATPAEVQLGNKGA